MKTAFLFPGQGSQSVGMGKALADQFSVARAVFEEVDAALGQSLSRIIWEGPESELTLTSNAQPALMAVSIAVLRVLESEAGLDLRRDASFVAGHSLGEYSALAASAALTLSDTARLLRLRGDSMQEAVPVGAGAMAALIGCERERADEIAAAAADGEICEIANDNGGGQIVISGARGAVERACEIAKSKGVKRALLLLVSAPFHCSLMKPAADVMAAALSKIAIGAPIVPLVANVIACATDDPAKIRTCLIEQVTGPVRWRESMNYLSANGVSSFVELGAGKVLSGLAKRIVEGSAAISVSAPDDISNFISNTALRGDRS